MRVKLTRLFAVALLMMISMGADAKIRVDIGNFEGGTIKEKSQTDPDEKGLVTVTISVTPDKGYTISHNDIVVVSTYSPSGPAGTRNDPQIAGTIDLLGKDPENLGDPREYTFIVASTLGAWVKEAKFAPSSKGPDRNTTEISDVDGLNAMTATGSYIITEDFDASNYAPTLNEPFTGKLTARAKADGTFPVITGLKCPLFTTASGATISNIMFKSIAVTGSGPIGAICGTANGATRIYNCGVLPKYPFFNDKTRTESSTVSSSDGYCGSLVGQLGGNARVINCFSYATITGGTTVAGIVGYIGSTEITQDNITTVPMVVNCMFYGEISGGSPKYPVYGGAMIKNERDKGVNPYCYFRKNATFDNAYTSIDNYNRSWPAEEKNLTRFEYYRSILNSNKRLCTYWVTDKVYGSASDAPTEEDEALIAKWVLDPSIAPYPILKKWGKYPSVININPDKVWDPRTEDEDGNTLNPKWVDRSKANEWEGKSYGTLTVYVNPGTHHTADQVTKTITITDMDTLNCDYGYYKIQLPYYNEVFGNPNGATHAEKYGDNYTDMVVTGWDITEVNGSTTGTGTFEANWETGYNFADRTSTKKDLKSVSGRTFAQGGYYYVPVGVTNIKIVAHWGKAVYLANRGHSIDRVKLTIAKSYKGDKEFTPAGTVPTTFQTYVVYNDLQDAIKALGVSSTYPTVYDQAIVLIGNHQVQNGSNAVGYSLDNKWHPFTIMSADFDFDNEPDYCLQLQFRDGIDRPTIQPIRFDFLPVVELGLAVRHDKKAYAIGIFIPQGHFEITETAFMRTTQFEFDGNNSRIETRSPMIINGGEFELFNVRKHDANRTSYFLLGGNAWVHRFAPGAHPSSGDKPKTKLCAVNAIGGEYKEFYLSGVYRPELPTPDNQGAPHCYTNGGKFGIMAGAGYDKVAGGVTFKINHSLIKEFYGGGINGTKANTIGGNIDVTIDYSRVNKYCGGPKVGDMTGKTVTTHATGTVFDVFYGGGNGGNSYYRQMQDDGDWSAPSGDGVIGESFWTNRNYRWSSFNPLAVKDDGTDNKGYHAEYEFEVFNQSNGVEDKITQRGFINWVQFGITITGDVESTLTDCTVKTNFYGGGNLATVIGKVTSTLTNTKVDGNVFGAGYSAAIPTFSIHDKENKTFPSMDFAGTITDGSIPYVKDGEIIRQYEWTNDLNGKTEEERKADPAYQKDGKWYCYTWNKLENLGAVLGTATLNILEGTIVEGSVYGGGDESNVTGNTNVNICAVQDKNDATKYNPVAAGGSFLIEGNVFGGGRGRADNFQCDKAMIGELNDGDAHPDGGTTVRIFNGTVNGNVYGGGEVGRVEKNTVVTIGTGDGVASGTLTSAPVIEGSVFGAGAGVNTHGYSALVRGNSTVTVQGNAKVKNSVYGGGEIASVGKYNINDAGMPVSLANQNRGYCTVNVKGYAEIGPDTPMEMKTATGYPDDAGHVFGAGRGVLPYEGVEGGTDGEPWRMKPGDIKQIFVVGKYKYEEGKENPNPKIAYLRYIETLALATQSYVTISGNALVKGSVYGGSMNGHVQHHTQVTITGGQIGCSKGTTGRLSNDVWDDEHYEIPEGTNLECASWDYRSPYAPFDIYDYVDATVDNPVPKPATDGHTFFGNVFGGGSGYYPYSINPDLTDEMIDLGYSDGLWHRDAGSVGGNSVVNITGGHILSSVYGGNEQTDVGTYVKDSNGDNTIEVDPNAGNVGKCTVNISGGTIGVPRTPEQINAHPVICNVFGAGKGDKRVNFNKWTNVVNTEVNISGTARIYGSVFGGGEDGHVIEDAKTNIGGSFTMTVNDEETEVSVSNDVLIGTTGTSGADGNVFGGGRGSVTALTAGVVGGNINLDIHGGTILGSVFGGGRLASVGTFFADPNAANYGDLQGDAGDTDHGNIVVNITKGTIGATDANGDLMTSKFTIGDVFGASKGSDDPSVDPRFGMVRNTTINITGGTINRSVFGGGEIGKVRENTTVNIGTKKTE